MSATLRMLDEENLILQNYEHYFRIAVGLLLRVWNRLYYQKRFSSAIDSRSKCKEICKSGIGKDNVFSCNVDVNSLNH